MKVLDLVVAILVLFDSVNWGLYGFLQIDLLAVIFGDMSIPYRLIYIFAGISGFYQILFFKKVQERWHLR